MAKLGENSKVKRFSVLMIFLVMTVIFFGAEVITRIFRPYYTPDTVKAASLAYTPSLFARKLLQPRAGLVEQLHSGGKEQFYINEAGYRGSSFPVQKPEGERRIVIVGGSAVFDIYAFDAIDQEPRDWPSLVEADLKSQGHENIRVINAGIPGHASFDSFGRLYSQIWMYEPDVVLLYNAWNDIKYFRKLSQSAPLISLYAPHASSEANPFINYQGSLDRLLSYSQFYTRYVRSRYFLWKINVGLEGMIEEGELQDSYSPFGPRQFQLNVELFVDTCRNIRATPILLTQATLVSRDTSEEDRIRLKGAYDMQKLTHDALVGAYEETYAIIRSVGQKKDVAILDLARQFNGRGDLFVDSVHTTQKGSQQFSKIVAQFLSELLDAKVS